MPSGRSRLASSALLFAAMASANAACPATGAVTVFASHTHDSFHLYHLLGERTFRFTVAGKSFKLDDRRIPGKALYVVDDKIVQSERVDRKNFAAFVRGTGEQATLDAQARYEQHYVSTELPKARIRNLGTRTRADDNGGNRKLFRLWTYEVPGHPGARTYFLSTLLDADTVIMVALNLPGTESRAIEELQGIAGSLQPVPAEHCDRIQWP